MSNEVIQRRCRRSPTGIEDCFGSTGGTGSTGTGGGGDSELFSGTTLEIGTIAPLANDTFLSVTTDDMPDGGQLGISWAANQTFAGGGAGALRATYAIFVDGVALPLAPRIGESANDVSLPVSDTAHVDVGPGTHTVEVVATNVDAAGTLTVENANLVVLAIQ